MSKNCCDCDYFFPPDICDLYERSTDSFGICDDYVCMESGFLWEEEDDGYPD